MTRLRLAASHIAMMAAVWLAVSCANPDNRARPDTVAVALRKSLDSCGASLTAAAGQRSVGGPAPAALGDTAARRDFPTFSVFVPTGARVTRIDTVSGGMQLEWPDCPGCRFSVRIQHDSGISLETRIQRMTAAQRVIDSINKDPHTTVGEFDEIDGPPLPIRGAAGRGYLINEDCGDCAATTLLFGRPGFIASIALGGDDDVPNLPRRLCEMTVLGKTFSWRR